VRRSTAVPHRDARPGGFDDETLRRWGINAANVQHSVR
jgi:hypothetical protein